MKRYFNLFVLTAFALAAPFAANADSAHLEKTAAAAVRATDIEKTAGLVKKVDKEQGKVTIKHGPLENLGMPAMTMVFRVKEPAMLDRIKAGDSIRFIADKVNGALTVMEIEQAQ